ncbi:MAG: ABC transporter substrate-binding protein [Ignavibacteriae bacterium]|nr:MAG: ABC transporter substrate-binding protein [Ignavibacteriota bacterium]
MKYTIILLFAFILFSSCSKQNTEDKIFRYNESQGIENLDPVKSSNYQTMWPLIQSLEGLMEFDKEMNIQSLLAESYTISPDGLIYTFKIRKNIFYHDDDCFANKKGRAVTASDFKYCFERVCDPRTQTRGSWLFRDRIKGALEYINSIKENKLDIKEIKGIKCPDDSTLVLTLNEPFAPFLSILTMSYASVYPKEAVDFYKENFGYHPVGTGPFKFVRWDFDKELVFEKNPTYWRKNKAGLPLVYLDGFVVTFTRSAETEFLDFKSGKLDYHSPSPEIMSQILDENGNLLPGNDFELQKKPWLNTVYLAVQLDKKTPGGENSILAENKKLRQAISYAIDREKIIKYVLKFKGYPAVNGPIPKGMPGFDENVKGYSFDKSKASQLLEEAGYPGGKGLTLKLTISNEETQKLIGEAVQDQLKDVGIDLQLDFIQGSTLRSSQVGGELTFWRANWGADYFDPENFMALFYTKNKTPNGPNYTHYSNPKTDELYEQAMKETDFAKRKQMYNEMERIVMDDAPWILLLYNEIVYLKSKRVRDMNVDGLNNLVLKWAKIE